MRTAACGLSVVAGLVLCVSAMGCGSGDASRLRDFLQEPRSRVSANEYRVLPPDALLINSIHVSDINGFRTEIRPDGKINLPLLGEVYVAGNTPAEIESVLKAKAREFYEEVDATVQVVEYKSQKIYVFGQVGRPGPFPWTGSDTLVDVLAQAQPTIMAWPERHPRGSRETTDPGRLPAVGTGGRSPRAGRDTGAARERRIRRRQDRPASEKPPTAEEAIRAAEAAARRAEAGTGMDATVITIDMMEMVKNGDMSANVLLKSGDIVYVPANPLAEVGLAIQQVLFPILPAATAVTTPVGAASMMRGGGQ